VHRNTKMDLTMRHLGFLGVV